VTIEELIAYVFGDAPSALATRCAGWAAASRRFKAFAESNRDKLRKKVRLARDAATVLDVEAEVTTAYRLVRDRRFAVTWEPPAPGGGRGPDFAVDFTTRLRFYVEVTRPRLGGEATPPGEEQAAEGDEPAGAARLAAAVCAKLGQLPPAAINVLVIAGHEARTAGAARAMADLKRRAERRDEAYFARRGFASARAFVVASYRLSAILLPDEAAPPAPPGLWLNPEATHPLPAPLRTALRSTA
jgi:hypothetical protein